MDNAVAVIKLGNNMWPATKGSTVIKGYIPTEAYPSGIALLNQQLYISNLEAKGSRILSESTEFEKAGGKQIKGYTIHEELASISIIPVPAQKILDTLYRKS